MTGQAHVPRITAPTTQTYQPHQAQRDSYNYTPRQFSAAPSGPVMVAKPQGYASGPTLMDRPVQGYQAPARAMDYSYRPQYTAGRTIPSPQWAIPQYPAVDLTPANQQTNSYLWDGPDTRTWDADGNQTGGPRYNTDGLYVGSWESGLSDGS